MKTYKDIEQTKTIEVLDQVTCDKCGKVIPVDPNGFWIGGGEVSISCGYGSQFDTEFDDHIFDLCDDCVGDLSKSLKWVSPWDSIAQKELLDSMQTPEAKAGFIKFGNAIPEQLGKAAVKAAKEDKDK